jgi:hypothetical protein
MWPIEHLTGNVPGEMFFHFQSVPSVKESSVSRVHCGVFAALLIATLAAGCGEGGPKLLPASGTVTYQGKPLEGALVSFLGQGNVLGSGTTDAAGKYTISTLGRPGAIPGKNQVAITKQSGAQGLTKDAGPPPTPPSPEEIQAKMKAAMSGAKVKNQLPEKYADPAQSGFTAEVAPGKSTFDFTLTD